MRLLRNWFRPKDQIKPVSFSRKYEIASFSAKHFSIFRLGLLRLSAGTYEATSSTATNVSQSFGTILTNVLPVGNVQIAYFLSQKGKRIANILRFLGRRESKLVRKNSKKLP